MSNHSVIEHRANYHFFKIEEDYIQICTFGEQYPQCKAAILAVLEHWMNDKRAKGQEEYVYLTYPEWIDALYGLFRRSTIIACLNELVEENLISRRPVKRHRLVTFEYMLNTKEVQDRIRELPARDEKNSRPNLNPSKFKRVQKQTDTNLNADTDVNLDGSEHENASKSKRNIDSITEIPSNIDSDTSLSSESDSPAENVTELEKWKEDTAERKAVSLHVATAAIRNDEEEDETPTEKRPIVLTITHVPLSETRSVPASTKVVSPTSNDDGQSFPLSQASIPVQLTVLQDHSLSGIQNRKQQKPGAGTRVIATDPPVSEVVTPPGDDLASVQALTVPPDPGLQAANAQASTGFSPPISGKPGAGDTPKRIKKTVVLKERAGPPPFPSESEAWGTTTCLHLFDYWRGAPLVDVGQCKYASSCAKLLAANYTRVQVVLVRTAMNNQAYWIERGGADVCDVARHMQKELNKLKMPAPEIKSQADAYGNDYSIPAMLARQQKAV